MSVVFDVFVLYTKIYIAEIIKVYVVFIIIHEHALEFVGIMKHKKITVFVYTCFKPFSTTFQVHVCSECGHFIEERN